MVCFPILLTCLNASVHYKGDCSLIELYIVGEGRGGGGISSQQYVKLPLVLQIIVFVYDITNHSSFENLEDWLAIVKRVFTKDGKKPPHFALVGNKSEALIHLGTAWHTSTCPHGHCMAHIHLPPWALHGTAWHCMAHIHLPPWALHGTAWHCMAHIHLPPWALHGTAWHTSTCPHGHCMAHIHLPPWALHGYA